MRKSFLIFACIFSAVASARCSKDAGLAVNDPVNATASAESSQRPGGSPEGRAAVVSNAAGATSTPQTISAGAPAAGPSASAAANPDTAKQAQIDWAIRQDAIKNEPHGQWAVEATASSTSGGEHGDANHTAGQATGAPNVERYGNNALAWSPKAADAGLEWLDLRYAKPVHATAVRVRESCGPGAVIKVELFDEQGSAHTVWQGNDITKNLDYLVVEFPKTVFKTNRVKLTLATNIVGGWNEIDAVQLVGTDQ
jgi:hypothetical protein